MRAVEARAHDLDLVRVGISLYGLWPSRETYVAVSGEARVNDGALWLAPGASTGDAMRALRAMYPDNPRLAAVSDNTRLIVSEPLSDLAGAWNEVPESSYGIVDGEHSELRVFRPRG